MQPVSHIQDATYFRRKIHIRGGAASCRGLMYCIVPAGGFGETCGGRWLGINAAALFEAAPGACATPLYTFARRTEDYFQFSTIPRFHSSTVPQFVNFHGFFRVFKFANKKKLWKCGRNPPKGSAGHRFHNGELWQKCRHSAALRAARIDFISLQGSAVRTRQS